MTDRFLKWGMKSQYPTVLLPMEEIWNWMGVGEVAMAEGGRQ